MRFDLFQVFFPQQLGVFRSHKKALCRYCVKKALFFQFIVGALGGNEDVYKRQLYDHSDGFFRRQLILTTKDKPADRTDDPFLVEKMCAELEGILLWCLEGLHRLVQNNFRFTVSERAAANVDTIKRSSNNVIDFMESEGYFRFKADYSISSKEFYDIYKQWCEDNACHSVSAIRFSAEPVSYTHLGILYFSKLRFKPLSGIVLAS